ncbi:UTP--glucose-1-phosphate uridylyltransferase [Acanthopleuribacter pedis]|uniref:UTP--glucose-1-phosphate uridylyltransferase n=1 Tax=Acanthopleuribacter pedis TaxID=442870 RepID=A0A8J7Q4G3_9BACT|nr:UTP--glucose-1-phosphate uridylyltransferase [Acanthopleuribacter pedis]MBO1317892.1 UTP--glucose-1-phosphate uridylyltransferase [Acanthopleuribacter pedis]
MGVKGVIVAAGYGSRFMPVTKTIPKEMLPLLNRPAISFIVEELEAAGIQDILIITSRRKKALDDYFDREVELEQVFERDGKQAALNSIRPGSANVFFVRQREMLGTGHALLAARAFVGEDPFVVAYPDDLFFGERGLSSELVKVYQQTGDSVLAVQDLGDVDVSRYGVVDVGPSEGHSFPMRHIVEKPAPGREPSKMVSYGRYLFTADLFPLLEEGWRQFDAAGRPGEFYHIDAINSLASQGKVRAYNYEGLRLDTGQIEGYLEAICRYALKREDTAAFARDLFLKLSRTD